TSGRVGLAIERFVQRVESRAALGVRRGRRVGRRGRVLVGIGLDGHKSLASIPSELAAECVTAPLLRSWRSAAYRPPRAAAQRAAPLRLLARDQSRVPAAPGPSAPSAAQAQG